MDLAESGELTRQRDEDVLNLLHAPSNAMNAKKRCACGRALDVDGFVEEY